MFKEYLMTKKDGHGINRKKKKDKTVLLKCNMVSWIGSWNRERTLVEKLIKSK